MNIYFYKTITSRYNLLTCILLLFFTYSHGQNHEWYNTFNSNAQTGSSTYANGLTIDKNNNKFIVGTFINDFTIQEDTIRYRNNYTSNVNNSFISKLDSQGNVVWTKTHYLYSSMQPSQQMPALVLANVKPLSNNRILICGSFYRGNGTVGVTVLKLSPTDSIVHSSFQSYISYYAIYDSIGNITKFGKFCANNHLFLATNSQLDIDAEENIYINIRHWNGTLFSDNLDTTINFINSTGAMQIIVVKFSKEFETIKWVNRMAVSNYPDFWISSLHIGLDNNLYIASNVERKNPNLNLLIDGVNFSNQIPAGMSKAILIVLDSMGKFVYKDFFSSNFSLNDMISDITAIDTGNFFVVGHSQDSLFYKGEWFSSSNNSSTGIARAFVANISLTKGRRFTFSNKMNLSVSRSLINLNNTRIRNDRSNNNIYAVFTFRANQNGLLTMGGLSDSLNNRNVGFAKFDTLGNALWLRAGVSTTDMQIDTSGHLIYCGNYLQSLILDPFSLPNAPRISSFITKITDYSITRGDVSAGPYCAGDTFLVPYTKLGEYDTANFFIAELSDENGRFEGGERELGKLKATEDSTIIGQLPLFQVASSPNYRIRVRSTHPPVQSFFRRDSLRLLIYSRDKADPGHPKPFALAIALGSTPLEAQHGNGVPITA